MFLIKAIQFVFPFFICYFLALLITNTFEFNAKNFDTKVFHLQKLPSVLLRLQRNYKSLFESRDRSEKRAILDYK